jgi:hypothetical protein
MTREDIKELQDINFGCPSEYEERYVRWADLSFNKDKLSDFLNTIEDLENNLSEIELQLDGASDENKKYLVRDQDNINRTLSVLYSIADGLDTEKIKSLLSGEPHAERLAAIEKWARIAAVDLLIDGSYSKETLSIITLFPQADYMLLVKRTQELRTLISDITSQSSSLMTGIPGA